MGLDNARMASDRINSVMLAWRPPPHTDVLDLGHGLGSSDSLR
jgi:hypothetical protein